MFSWTYDAPSGVYKNHEMSSQIRMAAIAQTKCMQFVNTEPGYGKKRGESITVTRISQLAEPTDGSLVENLKIPEDELSISTVAITVKEWGRAVPYTSLSDDLGMLDMENSIQKVLRDQMSLVMDKTASAAFKTTKVKAVPTGNTSINITTNGTPGATATVNIQVYHLEQIRDYMFGTLHVPPYLDDDYMCLISTKGKRGIVSDSNWEKWHQYTDPSNKFNSEIGRMESCRFVEVNNSNALGPATGFSGLGEALFFGEDAVSMAVAQDPELRAGLPEDFGRKLSVAWYGILNFGLIWDTGNAGEARVVHVTSA